MDPLGFALENFDAVGKWRTRDGSAQVDPKLALQAKINTYHITLFAHFLQQLRSIPDGEGTLLDQTLILYGSGMSNSNTHSYLNVPTMVVGGTTFGMKGARHLRYPSGTPLANLQLSMLQRMNLEVERFGDSTGTVSEL